MLPGRAFLAALVVISTGRAAAEEASAPRARTLRTVEDLFEVFQVGRPWPVEPLDLGTELHRFAEDGPEVNRPGGGNQLSGTAQGFEVGVLSNAADGTVKAVFARMEDAFDAGDAAQAQLLLRPLRSIFAKLAAGRACTVQETVEPAQTAKDGRTTRDRFGARRLSCGDGHVLVELYVDEGERNLAKGRTVSARAGKLGLQVRSASN